MGLLARLVMSPVGDLLPGGLVLLRYTSAGGAVITMPVQAAQAPGVMVVAAGQARRKRWWRHFHRPAPVQVWLAGTWCPATGHVTGSAEAAAAYRRRFPRFQLDDTTVLVGFSGPQLPSEPVLLRGTRLRSRWTAAATIGEFLGFSVPALAGAVTADAPVTVSLPAILAAGVAEGALLGGAQAIVLRRAVAGLRPWRWTAATATAALLAYLIGMLPSILSGRLAAVPPPLLIAAAATLGTILVTSIGVAQWLVLRPLIDRPALWIAISALAWIAGLGIFLGFATPLWRPGQPTAVIAAIGMAGGLLMAVTTAAITGEGLRRLL
ncbi:hypothetical protein [Actinoplanes sp. NPDC026670]|uniref:hypothetical protein n=1 Tax=Actinoplanes sp. NPDC026670 TaxID=3154700 RepID=UPI0033F03B59